MKRGLWHTVETLSESQPPAAVLAEWRLLAGSDFGVLEDFLRPTSKLAGDFPCLADPPCGCRHEMVAIEDRSWLARCECDFGMCTAPRLTEEHFLIHELDADQFAGEIGKLLGFE